MSEKAKYKIGDLIDNRYEVMKVMGGGMGEVYVCIDHAKKEGNKTVVLKTFTCKPDSAEYSTLKARFLREAEVWYLLGCQTELEKEDRCFLRLRGTIIVDEKPYLLMDYCGGGSLRDRIIPNGMPNKEAIQIATQLLLGLYDIADLNGIVHRDIKPDNILFTRDGYVKLTDLGIAKFMDSDDPATSMPRALTTLTQRNSIVGTVPYAAPELLMGNCKIDCRVDIWAFGIVLYEMLLGHRPFYGRDFDDIAKRIIYGAIPNLSDIKRICGKSMVMIITKCLQKDRDRRYRNILQLINDWDNEIRFDSSPAKSGFFRKDNRIYINNSRIESWWLDIFPDQTGKNKIDFIWDYDVKKIKQAEDLYRIGNNAAALANCKSFFFTKVNGVAYIDYILSKRLGDKDTHSSRKIENQGKTIVAINLLLSKSSSHNAVVLMLKIYQALLTDSQNSKEETDKHEQEKKEFEELCDSLVKANLQDKEILIMCAQGFQFCERNQEAFQLLNTLQRNFPEDGVLAYVLFVAAVRCLSNQDIVHYANLLLNEHHERQTGESQLLCARIARHFNDFSKMEFHSRKTLQLNPKFLFAMYLLVEALVNLKKKSEAEDIVNTMKCLDPTDYFTHGAEEVLRKMNQQSIPANTAGLEREQ